MEKKAYVKEAVLHLALLIVLLVADQLVKLYARNCLAEEPLILWKGVFSFQLVYNTGGPWGVLGKFPVLLTIASVLILGVVVFGYFWFPREKRLSPLRFCVMLIVAGAAGNLIDRIFFRKVTDIFSFDLINFPVFNIADICIVCGCILNLILLLFYYKDEDFSQWKKSKSK